MLISTILIFDDYFLNLFYLARLLENVIRAASLGLSLRAVFLIIIVAVVLLGMLAISNRKASEFGVNERDKLYEYKGNSFGYTVLIIGGIFTLGGTVLLELNPDFIAHSRMFNIPFLTAHILLLSFIVSELVRFSAQLYYYKSSD